MRPSNAAADGWLASMGIKMLDRNSSTVALGYARAA